MLKSFIYIYIFIFIFSVRAAYDIDESEEEIESVTEAQGGTGPTIEELGDPFDNSFNVPSSVTQATNSSDSDAGNEDQEIITNIINGKLASRNDYPFIAQLFGSKDGKDFRFMCTGSLIGPSHVLTAAHCVCDLNRDTYNPKQFKVIVGSISRAKDADMNKLLPVSQIFSLGYKEKFTNDIAILQLSSPVPPSMATPIKLYPYKIMDNSLLEIAGFGVTQSGNSNPSNILLKVIIKTSSSPNCKNFGNGWANNSGNQFCSENDNGNDSCQGDSGGPAVVVVRGQRYIAGITSYGVNKGKDSKSKCGNNVVAFYTRTAFFLNQISKVLGVPISSLYQ